MQNLTYLKQDLKEEVLILRKKFPDDPASLKMKINEAAENLVKNYTFYDQQLKKFYGYVYGLHPKK